MKIGVVGCGAVGSYYGARLLQAGNEVWFLLRSDYEKVKKDGVFFESVAGNFHVFPHAASSPEQIGICDLVLIGLKTTANSEFSRLIKPLVGSHTLILTLQNGLGNEEKLADLFGAENILGGLCFVCLNRIEPGYIRHIEHGKILLGEFGRPALPRTHAIAEMFSLHGVPCVVSDNLRKAHWDKLIWNIPYNGLGVAAAAGYETVVSGGKVDFSRVGECLPTAQLHADQRWVDLLIGLMEEVVETANALGLGICRSRIQENIESTACMGDYWASTLLDFKKRNELEVDSLFKIPLSEGKKVGVNMPRLEKMTSVIEQLSTLCKRK